MRTILDVGSRFGVVGDGLTVRDRRGTLLVMAVESADTRCAHWMGVANDSYGSAMTAP
jgi:hypothetical protein